MPDAKSPLSRRPRPCRTNAPGKTVQGSIPAAYERPEVDKCGHQRTSGNMTTHVRKHELKQRWPAWFPDSGSGFCNNYRPHLLPLRPAPKSADPKGLHPIIAAKWHKKDPVDFMATMRPRAETTNQTMAMFGQFKKDYGCAAALFHWLAVNGSLRLAGAYHYPVCTVGGRTSCCRLSAEVFNTMLIRCKCIAMIARGPAARRHLTLPQK